MTNETTSMDFEIDKTVGNEGEYGVKFNEPTTGEIVKMLRTVEKSAQVVLDNGFGTRDGENDIVYRTRRNTAKFAADRLESQEAQIKQLTEALAYANEWHKESVENATNELRELSGITGELERFRTFHERYAEQTSKKYIDDICALTARAESAEAERDAAVNDLRFLGKNGHTCRARKICIMREIDQSTCIDCKMWHWRGLPQEGEGK